MLAAREKMSWAAPRIGVRVQDQGRLALAARDRDRPHRRAGNLSPRLQGRREEAVRCGIDKPQARRAVDGDRRDQRLEAGIERERPPFSIEDGSRQSDRLQRPGRALRPLEFEPGREQHGPCQVRPHQVETRDQLVLDMALLPLALGMQDEGLAGRRRDRGRDPDPQALRQQEIAIDRLVRHLAFREDVDVAQEAGMAALEQAPRPFIAGKVIEMRRDDLIELGR
jgi:hypothetical protein